MAASKVDVLTYLETRRQVTATDLIVKFRLTRQAARRHLDRLTRYGLIAPSSSEEPLTACTFTLTLRGRRRLAWYRLPDDARGETIEFA